MPWNRAVKYHYNHKTVFRKSLETLWKLLEILATHKWYTKES